MSHSKPNRLVHATSPYLLQHAHNPVDWFEWGQEALDKATSEDKPILVSIGYSSCHWCHVMERESFEVNEIAQLMNETFVCIKVDREERPDIDQIYMDAVQALGVNGGWPLNVFLTPQQKPFFGGTYFSPQAWIQILRNVGKAFLMNRNHLEETAEELQQHLSRSDVERFVQKSGAPWEKDLDAMFNKLATRFDTTWGGMDKAPKFVMPSVWRFLLQYHYVTKNSPSLNQVRLTLDKIAAGGIYDQIGGGFARYSVDAYWFVPHFEKMLYDNAQLLSLYSEAYAVTQNETYKTVVYETVGWLLREMTHADGGFYSALDADSEGVEGQYYVWKQSEIAEALGTSAEVVAEYYNVTQGGNWEHGNNILMRDISKEISKPSFNEALEDAKQRLLAIREKRVKPGLDDKIITSWNAMMICGLADAYGVFGDERFLAAALKNMNFIEDKLSSDGKLFRSYKAKRSSTPGFLDDYAYVIQAQLKLYHVTFDETWIHKAAKLIPHVLENYYDTNDGFFFYTSGYSEKLITRKKEIFDNVIPSSNAIMAQNLFAAGSLLENEDWKQKAFNMTEVLGHIITSEPNYMSQWAIAYIQIRHGLNEVLLTGKGIHSLRSTLQKEYLPFVLLQGSSGPSTLPLFEGKPTVGDRDTIYVCYQRTCGLPVHTLEDAREQIR
ncbi:MAG TPA: thioredoxin domain-containing protein [Chryseolinea sp.]